MSVTFKHVNFTYSPRSPFEYEALRDINLLMEGHHFSAIVGHTGSGKSTLVQLINALLLPSTGIVAVDDELIVSNKKYLKKLKKTIDKPKKHSEEDIILAKQLLAFSENKKTFAVKSLRKKVGMVFQFPEYQLFEETVEKDVAFGPRNFGVNKIDAIKLGHAALAKVGLDESYYDRSPFELSGGERRRVAIAGILAIEPDLLILDEPTAGLDPLGAKAMMELFNEIYEAGTSIILVTHDMDIVLRHASNVIVMDKGQIVKESNPIALFGEDTEQYSLESPVLFEVSKKLIKAGYDIEITKIQNENDLAKAISLGRKR